MSKIILIKGLQGSGKTAKAHEIINREPHIEIEYFQIQSAIMIYGTRKYILICNVPKSKVKSLAARYLKSAIEDKPTLIICTRDLAAQVDGAEVITL